MEVIGVPASIMLEAMLKELNLLSPKYERNSLGGACFEAKVLFYPSMQFLQNSTQPHSILGYMGDTMEEATNIAATQAIKYMKNNENKVLKDYSYDELQKEKKVNRALGRQMEAKNLKLHNTISRLTKTSEAYNNYLNTVRNASKCIQKMISDHARAGTNLLDIQAMVDNLNQQTHQANTCLATEGEFPYYGPDENELSTEHYESEDEDAINWNSEVYNYDSDGRPIDYEV